MFAILFGGLFVGIMWGGLYAGPRWWVDLFIFGGYVAIAVAVRYLFMRPRLDALSVQIGQISYRYHSEGHAQRAAKAEEVRQKTSEATNIAGGLGELLDVIPFGQALGALAGEVLGAGASLGIEHEAGRQMQRELLALNAERNQLVSQLGGFAVGMALIIGGLWLLSWNDIIFAGPAVHAADQSQAAPVASVDETAERPTSPKEPAPAKPAPEAPRTTVNNAAVTPKPPTVEKPRPPPPPPPKLYVSVTVPRARIRAGPGTSHRKLESVVRSEQLEIVDQEGDWYQVNTPRHVTGWIRSDLADSPRARAGQPGEGSP